MLALDDERWKDLPHRGWSKGKRSKLDPDAPFIPDELKKLIDDPKDFKTLRYISPYLCSEGTTWDAAFAAIPYLVELAKRLSPKERLDYLIFLGFMVIDAGSSENVEDFFREDYEKAL